MYKVFINDKSILLTDNFDDYRSEYDTLFIHYGSPEALFDCVELLKTSPIVNRLCVYSSDLKSLWETFCGRFKIVKAAGGVVQKDDKVLMIYKNGHWDLPKGKIDGAENNESGALREVREECGLTSLEIEKPLENSFYLYTENGDEILKWTHWFLMRSETDGPLQGDANEGITDVQWMSRSDWENIQDQSYISVKNLLASVF